MKKFKGMLLACDMDGTLLDDSKQIPAENLRALQYFTKQGGRLSLATGRSPHAIGIRNSVQAEELSYRIH